MATAAVTAWGKPTIKCGASGEGGTLGASLEDVGKIKENTTTLELVKGTSSSVKDTSWWTRWSLRARGP